jgi:hypothetical protein
MRERVKRDRKREREERGNLWVSGAGGQQWNQVGVMPDGVF